MGGAMTEVFPALRPFWWLPVSGERHAIHADDRGAPIGVLACDHCWNEACTIIGAR